MFRFLGAVIAFVLGFAIVLANYFISRWLLAKKPNFFPYVSTVRQALQIGFLVLLYFVAPHTPWSLVSVLVGGALGITIPMFFTTYLLVRESDKPAVIVPKDIPAEKKEEDKD